MAMTAQEYLDTFNAAINAGAYDSAANILKAAEGDFGPGVYDVAGVVLESNPNLPPEIDYMSPQGRQSIRDYVASVPAPVTAAVAKAKSCKYSPKHGINTQWKCFGYWSRCCFFWTSRWLVAKSCRSKPNCINTSGHCCSCSFR
jgi:hypothetical protein